jgi:predicted Fe-Mo cluster-binding NifX family protein
MKIGITVEDPDLEAPVAQRFGLCRYLLVVDSEALTFEAVPNPGASPGTQSGIQIVILAISKGVEMLITGYISPTAEKHLTENGIRVIPGVQGAASAALNSLRQDPFDRASASFHGSHLCLVSLSQGHERKRRRTQTDRGLSRK